MGFDQRRIENQNRTISDYTVFLFQHLEKQGLVSAEKIEGVFLVTQTPDYQIPPTSCVIHGRLKLNESTYCIDINDGCAGYIKAINEACMFLQSSSAQCAMIIAGDILSPKVSKYDRNSYPLIGDAVTISILKKTACTEKILVNLMIRGSDHEKLIIPAGGLRNPSSDESRKLQVQVDGNKRTLEQLHMHGGDVFAFTQSVVPEFILDNLKKLERTPKNYSRFYFHQANIFILDKLRQKFDLNITQMPDRVIREYGNSSSATIPMLIASEQEKVKMKCLLAGFGVGLAWGIVDLTIDTNSSAGIHEL
nr:3-oxoacyl-[acyl-carrier-protein] synthase III C-terminal domain-containing protein [Polynucleobacter sp. AP-Feld-500C-C5]